MLECKSIILHQEINSISLDGFILGLLYSNEGGGQHGKRHIRSRL